MATASSLTVAITVPPVALAAAIIGANLYARE